MAASKAGRPTVYDPDYHPEWGEKFSLLGFTNEEMAEAFRIDATTLYAWLERHDEFSKAVTRGKAPADANVAMGLYKRGTGYDIQVEKVFCSEGSIVTHDTMQHIPPDPGAALNWLKNRQPDKWRDKKQLELEGEDGEPMAFPVVRVYSPKPKEPGDDTAS